ncbi:hypothetical protein EON65_01295 [archaeon]|nr:MAG: hypothetical protein EON65_01295 [archaeon]
MDVRALKVVQGLEAENTNKFLIALAECAANPAFDNEAAVVKCLRGEEPGQSPPPLRSNIAGIPPAEAKPSAPSAMDNKGGFDGGGGGSRGGFDAGSKDSKEDAKRDSMDGGIAPERGKSRSGTRGGKPNQPSADVGLSGFSSGSAPPPNLDAEIERCDGSEAMTQQLLGPLITRPKLSEKLLAKPPFRFLHDIIMEVIRATGFGTGLFTDAECDSASVADKTQKLIFLELSFIEFFQARFEFRH